eukprot:3583795-Prymnesium_polylepis.1
MQGNRGRVLGHGLQGPVYFGGGGHDDRDHSGPSRVHGDAANVPREVSAEDEGPAQSVKGRGFLLSRDRQKARTQTHFGFGAFTLRVH